MKRIIISLLLVLVTCVSISACESSENQQESNKITKEQETSESSEPKLDEAKLDSVCALIDAIGEVTVNSEEAIIAAENAYEALSAEEKAAIQESADKLVTLRNAYDAAVAEMEANIAHVVELIDAIGEVTIESKDAIVAAENAYKALSAEEKAAMQESADKLTAYRDAYDTAVMEANAAKVVDLIDAIGKVTLDSKTAIETAKEQYNTLSSKEKQLVSNYNTLKEAESQYNALVKAQKEATIQKYSSKFEIKEDKVDQLKWYLHEDMPEYIDTRCYIVPYIGVKNNVPWICIRYNYTEDDWIFWESLTIVADDQRYTKYVGSFETTRDNGGGEVWEYYDEVLDRNQALNSKDLQMLQAIADSEETIIRFQGDDYHYDYIVTKTDKSIIRDVLALYSALMS